MLISRPVKVLLCAVLTLSMDHEDPDEPVLKEPAHGGYADGKDVPMPAEGMTPKSALGGRSASFLGDEIVKVHGFARQEGVKEPDYTKPGAIMEIPSSVAIQSIFIKNMIDDSGTDEEMMLPNCTPEILEKVVEYCQYHAPAGKTTTITYKDGEKEVVGTGPAAEIQKPLKSTNLKECGVSEWDADYVDIEQEILFDLILAANYLDIKPLLDLTCAKIASMIKGKNVEQIRKQFNIVNDFTPEEEAQVREENRWCEDPQA